MQIQEQVPLGPLTTFNIGGPARFFARVASVEELTEALAFAKEKQLQTFILGGGSNVLVRDTGFGGLVIKIELMGVEEDGTTLIAGAGENWDALVQRAVSKGLWGVENLSGIPGTVGGAVVQNIGAYGQALSQTLLWAEVYDTRTGEIKRLSNHELATGYRSSTFKQEDGRYVVLKAALGLGTTPAANTSYKDLKARFEGKSPALAELRQAVLEIRAAKFPDLAVEGTAGSFFKNPVVDSAEAQRLQTQYPELPTFPLPESDKIKIPLGWFLDYRHGVLDMRNVRMGGARMYEKQFLVLVAARGTSSDDVEKLSAYVQEKIREILHVAIEPEVKIV